jgi:hypothetical protein
MWFLDLDVAAIVFSKNAQKSSLNAMETNYKWK